MAKQRAKGLVMPPAKFLLTCSTKDLDEMELARLADVANHRAELMELLDRMIDSSAQALVIKWFRENDRDSIKSELLQDGALDTESIQDWAKRMIRGGGLLLPRARKYKSAGQAHRVAAATYSKRNIAKGKCMSCPEPLDANSVRYCTKHLAMQRAQKSQKKGLSNPGSREYLYAGDVQPTPGRSAGNLQKLAMNREQKTRELLAELGIPPESAAVTLNAAKEALMRCMPIRRGFALTQQELFQAAIVPSKQTGIKALNLLLSEQAIERIGMGGQADPYRYFVRPA
jgi:hypothetical protein